MLEVSCGSCLTITSSASWSSSPLKYNVTRGARGRKGIADGNRSWWKLLFSEYTGFSVRPDNEAVRYGGPGKAPCNAPALRSFSDCDNVANNGRAEMFLPLIRRAGYSVTWIRLSHQQCEKKTRKKKKNPPKTDLPARDLADDFETKICNPV